MNNIDSWLSRQVAAHKSPSIQYAFFDRDTILHQYKSGLSNVAGQSPIRESTTYNLFSITKTFTALAVLQLAQDGKLDLKSPAAKYLPAFPYTGDITVNQLLSHTAGIPNPMPLRWTHLATEHAGFDGDRFFSKVFSKHNTLKSQPGSRFKYSNLGYVLLGQLIAQVSGQPYQSYIEEHIIRRAGIDSASLGFGIDTAVHATGYHKTWSISNMLLGMLIDKRKFMEPAQGVWQAFRPFHANGAAYGGMTGSAGGLISYAQALLRNDGLLLDEANMRLLFREVVVGGKPCGMALSWYTGSLNGHKYFAHAGGGGGYYVELRIYPEEGLGSVLFFNRSGMKDERMLDVVDRFLLAESSR